MGDYQPGDRVCWRDDYGTVCGTVVVVGQQTVVRWDDGVVGAFAPEDTPDLARLP